MKKKAKKKPRAAKQHTKNKVTARASKLGRPPKKFTKLQVSEIESMAFDQCQNKTIAKVIGVDVATLEKHFSTVLTKKRAEGKAYLHRNQMAMAATVPTMSIFLGKNYLDQKDQKDHQVNVPALEKPITIEIVKKRIRDLDKETDGIDRRSVSGKS